MFYSVSSYSVGSYEAYWKDVLVLQEVAEAVAAQVNADTGTQSVDANALAEVLKDVALAPPPGEGDASGTATASEGGTLDALRTLNTDALGTAARQLTDTLLRPLDAEQMAASASEAEATGVSGLSVAMAVAVVESLSASVNSTAAAAAAPGKPGSGQAGLTADQPTPSIEAAQDHAITRMQDATSEAWAALSEAAASSDLDATVQSAQHVDTMSKALGLLASGVVQVQVNEQTSTATLAAAVEHPPVGTGAAPTAASLPAETRLAPTAPLVFPPAWQAPMEQGSTHNDVSSPPPPSAPLKRFIWVAKQVLAWRWKERTVTVVQESPTANQALDDKKMQDKEHSQDDRRYLKHLELQSLAQKAAWQHRARDSA